MSSRSAFRIVGITLPVCYRYTIVQAFPPGLVIAGDANIGEYRIVSQRRQSVGVGVLRRMLAPISVPRGYHATTVLLPDGRVLVSGTTPHGNEELRMEVYSPYYLFKGERLVITEVAQSISYGQSFQVGYSCETSSIKSAVLIRPGSMTHAFDMDQRYVQLEISDNADNRLTIKAPPDAHIAPPGYYMLFLLSDEGVPSKAKFVHLPIKR